MKNIILFFVLFFCACGNHKSQEKKDANVDDAPNQQLSMALKRPSEAQKFNDFFTLDAIVPIQMNDDIVLSYIKKVICYKNKLIVLDHHSTIAVVDALTGRIESSIKRIGNGPGESKTIIDIAFDEENEILFVHNDYFKLLYFRLNGEFIREEQVKGLYDNLICYQGILYFYCERMGLSSFPYKINYYNPASKIWGKAGIDTKVDFPVKTQMGGMIVRSKRLWFAAPLDLRLFTINELREIISPYQLKTELSLPDDDLVKYSLDDDPFLFHRKAADRDIIYGIQSIRETDHYMIFKANNPGIFIIDKETQNTYWEKAADPYLGGLLLMNYYPHDGDDNRIMFVVQPSEWLHEVSVNGANIADEWKEKVSAVNVDEESNPILLFYREKTNDDLKKSNAGEN